MNFTYMLMILNLIYLILRDLHALKDNAGIVTEIVTKLEDPLVRIIGLDKMNIQLNHHEQERGSVLRMLPACWRSSRMSNTRWMGISRLS